MFEIRKNTWSARHIPLILHYVNKLLFAYKIASAFLPRIDNNIFHYSSILFDRYIQEISHSLFNILLYRKCVQSHHIYALLYCQEVFKKSSR